MITTMISRGSAARKECNRTKLNKPRTAQVGAISKAQKDSKTTFSTTGDNKVLKKLKTEKKFRIFLNFFSKFPVSRIVPKNVKGRRFLSHVRRFGCVEKEVLSTYGKNS